MEFMRRAKIVCTIGPAVDSPEKIRALVDAGMDVARINRSHGSYEDAERHIALVRRAAEQAGRQVGVLVDLQGPKIRTGRFATGPVLLNEGDQFTITIDDIEGDGERVSTTFKGLTGDVRAGDTLLVDDGKITLRAVEVTPTDVVTEVVEGGTISNNKGINLPAFQSAFLLSRRRTKKTFGGRCASALTGSRSPSSVTPAMSSAATRSWKTNRYVVRFSPRLRNLRLSLIWRRSSVLSTASWSLEATSVWRCRWKKCRSSRSKPSRWLVARPSRSSSPLRCSSR